MESPIGGDPTAKILYLPGIGKPSVKGLAISENALDSHVRRETEPRPDVQASMKLETCARSLSASHSTDL